MNIEELTIKEVRELTSLLNPAQTTAVHPYKVGSNYFIRTVTMSHCGKLVAVTPQELVLEAASWIADSGRFQQALETGDFSEVEMFPKDQQVIVGRGAIVDAVIVSKLPISQK